MALVKIPRVTIIDLAGCAELHDAAIRAAELMAATLKSGAPEQITRAAQHQAHQAAEKLRAAMRDAGISPSLWQNDFIEVVRVTAERVASNHAIRAGGGFWVELDDGSRAWMFGVSRMA